MHEVFITYDGTMYLCFLKAQIDSNFAPYAICYGPE